MLFIGPIIFVEIQTIPISAQLNLTGALIPIPKKIWHFLEGTQNLQIRWDYTLLKYARAKNAYFSVKHIWINKKLQKQMDFLRQSQKHKMFKNFKFDFSID